MKKDIKPMYRNDMNFKISFFEKGFNKSVEQYRLKDSFRFKRNLIATTLKK